MRRGSDAARRQFSPCRRLRIQRMVFPRHRSWAANPSITAILRGADDPTRVPIRRLAQRRIQPMYAANNPAPASTLVFVTMLIAADRCPMVSIALDCVLLHRPPLLIELSETARSGALGRLALDIVLLH